MKELILIYGGIKSQLLHPSGWAREEPEPHQKQKEHGPSQTEMLTQHLAASQEHLNIGGIRFVSCDFLHVQFVLSLVF